MIMTNKILAVALIAALVGGSLGAAVMHSRDSSRTADIPVTSDTQTPAGYTDAKNVGLTNASYQPVPAEFKTAEEQTAYKVGFADGFQSCANGRNVGTSGVTYRNAANATTRSNRVYYDYGRSHGRTFWQKHRDKLTMAIGTGAGAALGGLIGGKKGAGIGALAGLGGSALYTYKLRKRTRRY
jgi:hypothetical protein